MLHSSRRTVGVRSLRPIRCSSLRESHTSKHASRTAGPSSPCFLRRIYSLIRYDEEERCLFGLQGSELARLLDFLDRVCTFLSAFRLATKQALQTIDAIPSSDDIYMQCFCKPQAVCGHHAALSSEDQVTANGDPCEKYATSVHKVARFWPGYDQANCQSGGNSRLFTKGLVRATSVSLRVRFNGSSTSG